MTRIATPDRDSAARNHRPAPLCGCRAIRFAGAAAAAATVSVLALPRTARAQARGTIQATVRVVDDAPSARTVTAALRLIERSDSLPGRTARRDLRGATIVAETPRRVLIIHW